MTTRQLPVATLTAVDDEHIYEPSTELASGLALQVEGTFTGTLQFECQVKGASTWGSIRAQKSDDGTYVTSVTAPDIVSIISDGKRIRVRVSAISSGSIDVYACDTIG